MNQDTIKSAVEAALIADCYLLGSHWIYDADALKNLSINWDELNAPCATWHEGKGKGDFTHYGDHAKWLETSVKDNGCFNLDAYRSLWLKNMKTYKGYIDGATKETLEMLEKDATLTQGSHSHDLSIVGSIAPLLYVSNTKADFLASVANFVAFTHNDARVLNVANLFASILYDVANGSSIKDAMNTVEVDASLKSAFDAGVASCDQDTVESIQAFGAGCPVDGGFEGTVHLLSHYDNFKDAMVANAKAGGDSASRGMVVGMIMGAVHYDVPTSWRDGTKGLLSL